MQVEHSILSFELTIETTEVWEKQAHKHSFFELVYIKKGKGKQCINHNNVEYEEGNIFFLPPLDCHSFIVEEKTTFVFLKFSDQLFEKNNSYEINTKKWFENISYILRNYNKTTGNIINSQQDKDKVIKIIEIVILENNNRDRFSSVIIQGLIIGLLNILMRHIEENIYRTTKPNNTKFNLIIKHIQNNLFKNEKLKIPFLANKFNVSKTYFSEYFKTNFGSSLNKYILISRLRVVETRLLYSDFTIKQIAYEVGFSDTSHLSNVFKKHYQISISDFRKKGEYRLLKNSTLTNCSV
ncbi:MAG TPA: AraC family transcriptional regulator [Crocinitomix sp.]|nr:AraC family transcriptional regulator [Crocinitomix sp.]